MGKQLLKVNNKFYMVDMGIRNHILPRKRYDLGFTIENIVYLELSRRGGKVNIGKYGSTEVDFVTQKEGVLTYYQVTADMTAEETFEREMRPLRSIQDNYEKNCPDTGSIFTRKLRWYKSCECHRLAFGMRNLHMSEVEISQKQQIDSNDQKPDGKSVTESLTGILKEDDLDARKAKRLKEKYETA